jgi:aminoglycoside/choline kinase family phosphotransferase
MHDRHRIRDILNSVFRIKIRFLSVRKLRGDASNRTYYRIRFAGAGRRGSVILMQLAEPEAFKKSEEKMSGSRVRIRELPYINILRHLAASGVAVPRLYFHDRPSGRLFLEDLGDRTFEQTLRGRGRGAVRRRYEAAIDELIRIQTRASRRGNGRCIAFGRAFDVPLLMWEFDHFLEFGVPYCAGRGLSPADRRRVRSAFRRVAAELAALPRIFTHRDYHSRNLMVHEGKIRVLDFQDALLGPHVYDLASLLRDSYRTIEDSLVDELVRYYWERMKNRLGPADGPEGFRRRLDLMSIQRNLKAAGRFAYIDRVKRNPRYLAYIPRTLRYVRRNLERHPELSSVGKTLLPYLEGAFSR